MTDLVGTLSSGRALAEARMRDTCRITRSSPGGGGLDPVTGLPSGNARTVVYGPDSSEKGKCRVRTGGTVSVGAQRQSAGDVVTQVASVLSVPVSAARLVVDDRVEILTSDDPLLPSMTFTVSGLVPGSQMTAQRVQVTAVID